MSTSEETLQDVLIVPIVGDLTIYTVNQVKSVLLAHVDVQPGLSLDLSQVVEIDTAGLQLLVSAKNTLARSGKPMSLCNPSDAVKDFFSRCNFECSFGIFMTKGEAQ